MGDAMELMAAMVLEDGRWGEVAAPFQIDDARAVLEPEPGAARLNWLSRGKGTSKTTDVSAMTLAWLVAQSAALDEGYVIASDEEQANRLLNRARALIVRTPGLRGVVEVQARSIVNTRNGARVVALAADVAGAEGVLTPWIAVDELPNWADTTSARGMWTAAFSSTPKVKGCRLTVIGHAGQPGSWQHQLFERARSSSAWRVNHLEGPAPWITDEALEEQRALLLPSQFERRWLNRWTQGEDRLAMHEDVRACVQLDGPQEPKAGQRYVIGLDVGVTKDRCVAAVMHAQDVGGRSPAQAEEVGEYEAGARFMLRHGKWDQFTFDQRMVHHREGGPPVSPPPRPSAAPSRTASSVTSTSRVGSRTRSGGRGRCSATPSPTTRTAP